MPSKSQIPAPQASLRGAFFIPIFACIFAFLSSCDSKETPTNTPDWRSTTPASSNQTAKASAAKKVSASPSAEHLGSPTTFMFYNIRNYLSMPRGPNSAKKMTSKPEGEITALIRHITSVAPDVLAVCEIGTQADLLDLQRRLKSAGHPLPFSHLHGGSDPYRRLAILSRHPLSPQHKTNETFKIKGKPHRMLRGILDVTIQLPSGPARFLGVHLKSKRHSKYWDQAQLRRHEAETLRQHVNNILSASSSSSDLLIFGDFNDTKQSASIRAIVGAAHTKNHLSALDLKDQHGTRWTHYWAYQDVYSRFDYIFTSPSMKKRIDKNHSRILTIPPNDPASDHRPLVVEIN